MPLALELPKPQTGGLVRGIVARFPVFVSAALDPAFTDKKGSDASGITVVGTDPAGSWWVFEADPFRGQPSELVERVLFYAVRYRPQVLSIEKVAAQFILKDLIAPRLEAAGLDTQVVEYTESNRTGKHARIVALQPLFKQKKVRIRAGLTELLNQLENYAGPGSLPHEDLLDSLAQHLVTSRAASLAEIAPVGYAPEVMPSKRDQQRYQSGDRLDGTFTGGAS